VVYDWGGINAPTVDTEKADHKELLLDGVDWQLENTHTDDTENEDYTEL